jgi:hypothetical protein
LHVRPVMPQIEVVKSCRYVSNSITLKR